MGINWFKKAQEGYKDGVYTNETLKNWVVKNKITRTDAIALCNIIQDCIPVYKNKVA